MKKTDYFEQRNIDNTLKLREIRRDLPKFCDEFFIGIENRTTPLTRLEYAYDLRIFFYYLFTETREFQSYDVSNFGVKQLDEVTTSQIESFLEFLNYYEFEGTTYSNTVKTKARKLSTIKSFFKYFYNKDAIDSDPASKVLTPKLHEKPIIRLEVDEVTRLLDSVDSGEGLGTRQAAFHEKTRLRDLAIMTLFLGTGIRISELVGLDVDDLDFNVNGFKITRKGGSQTILYFSDEVADALLAWLDERAKYEELDEVPALFVSLQKKRMSVRSVELLVKKYAQIVTPLKKITPHKLRSTYGTELYRETGDIYVVAEVLGHKDINTTKRHYAAISDDIKRDAARKVILRDPKNCTIAVLSDGNIIFCGMPVSRLAVKLLSSDPLHIFYHY